MTARDDKRAPRKTATYHLTKDTIQKVDLMQSIWYEEKDERIEKSQIVQAAINSYFKKFEAAIKEQRKRLTKSAQRSEEVGTIADFVEPVESLKDEMAVSSDAS